MTTFASYSHIMPSHDFDLFNTPNDTYAEMTGANGGFPLPANFFDSPSLADAMSTLDSSAPLYAPSQIPRSAEFLPPQSMKHYFPREATPPAVSQSFDHMPRPQQFSSSSESGASAQSTASSALGSPSLRSQQQAQAQYQVSWGLGLGQVPQEPFVTSAFDQDLDKQPGCVDPSLINPFGSPNLYSTGTFGTLGATASPRLPFVEHPPSPAPSNTSNRSQAYADSRRFKISGSQSPYLHTYGHQPYPPPLYPGQRRNSQASIHSRHSNSSQRSNSFELDDDSVQRGLCPIADCGRVFKDLKAHMLTHQNERPEKCPITTCEYHIKGFARKYDKNRHTLTHYKGTMVCGFCPHSGSAAEKSFNRADVFKRHLTSVHGVEQTPPNSRKKSPNSASKKGFNNQEQHSGTCSTCGNVFTNVQEFYEHLDDCVMRVVQQTDPCETINQKNLGSVQNDAQVQETLDRHSLPSAVDSSQPADYEEDADEDDDLEEQPETDDANDETYGSSRSSNPRAGKGTIKSRKTGNPS